VLRRLARHVRRGEPLLWGQQLRGRRPTGGRSRVLHPDRGAVRRRHRVLLGDVCPRDEPLRL